MAEASVKRLIPDYVRYSNDPASVKVALSNVASGSGSTAASGAASHGRPKQPETVADVIDIVRCAKCGSKPVKEYRLSYEGASQAAMRGAEQGQQGGLAAVTEADR